MSFWDLGVGEARQRSDWDNIRIWDGSEWISAADGREVSRADHAALFAVYGERYGAGDGLTTFNLPDFRGRVLVGGE